MRFAFLLAILVFTKAFSEDSAIESWRVMKDSPVFSLSATFDFKKEQTIDATVVRTGLFCPRYYYDLFDSQGEFQSRGVTRAISLGFFCSWAIDIDLYDANSNYFGLIQGKMITKARSKFIFYDGQGMATGVAYLNTEHADLIIVSPEDESHIIAKLKGDAFGDVSSWEVKIFDPALKLDERLLKTFAAFVADYHKDFLPQPKEVYHYYYNSRGY